MKDEVNARQIICNLRIWVSCGTMYKLIRRIWEYITIGDAWLIQRRILINTHEEIIFTIFSFIFSYLFLITCSWCAHPLCLILTCWMKVEWRMCMTCSLLQWRTCSVMISESLIAQRYVMFARLWLILWTDAYFAYSTAWVASDCKMSHVRLVALSICLFTSENFGTILVESFFES